MTTPLPHTVCPACGKGHAADPNFGFCCNAQCLAAAMRGEIIEPKGKKA